MLRVPGPEIRLGIEVQETGETLPLLLAEDPPNLVVSISNFACFSSVSRAKCQEAEGLSLFPFGGVMEAAKSVRKA